MILIKLENMIPKFKYILVTSIFLVSFSITKAQEISVPIDVQLEILPKILSLNKSFALDNPKTELHIGILYSSKQRNSTKVKDEIFTHLLGKELTIRKAKVIFIPIDFTNVNNIKDYLTTSQTNILYFAPLRGYDISSITNICKAEKIITFTGVSTLMDENGVSVGFELENNKLQITINLESAKAEGANFSSRLLKVSQVK